jgi:hypothetical protein
MRYKRFFLLQIQIGWSPADDADDIRDDELALSAASVAASWECDGVLISENYVLTSAQCLTKKKR